MSNSTTIQSGLKKNSALCRHLLMMLSLCLFQFGCASVGPDYETPETPVVEDWTDDNPVISRDTIEPYSKHAHAWASPKATSTPRFNKLAVPHRPIASAKTAPTSTRPSITSSPTTSSVSTPPGR